MACPSDPLPDDVETLKRLLIGRDQLIEKLKAEIARLKRWRFGRSSERIEVTLAQLQLALDELQVTAPPDNAAPAVEESVPISQPKQRAVSLRRPPRSFPEHLPRETIVHAPRHCTCPDCGAAMRRLGEDISEMLDYQPGYFKVIRHVRPKLSCSHCSQVIQMLAPSRPIERGIPAPGLLAQVIVAKYADHLSAVSPAGHLPPRRHRAGACDIGQLGGRRLRAAEPASRGAG